MLSSSSLTHGEFCTRFGCCTLTRCYRGIFNTYGAFQTYYEENTFSSNTASAISWIGSIQGFLLLLVGALTGPIFDMGYFRQLVIVGTFLMSFGLMMCSLSTKYYEVRVLECSGGETRSLNPLPCTPGLPLPGCCFWPRERLRLRSGRGNCLHLL